MSFPDAFPARVAAAALAAAALAGCTITADPPDLWGQDVALTILHTSDIHSRIYPYDLQPNSTDQNLGLRADAPPYGGVARLGALIERERARSGRTIHLDSGDCFQGAPVFNQNDGEVEVRWLSQVKADAVVIGNHEFDAGVANLARQYELWGTYPLLSANYDFYDWRDPRFTELGRLARPYEVVNVDGLKVGIIGMANLSSLNSIGEDQNSLQVTPAEQNETVRAWAEFLGPQVDLIGVVSHLGLTEDQELVHGREVAYERKAIESFLTRKRDPWEVVEELPDGKVLVKIPGVRNLDFIAGGHLHIVTNPPQQLVDRDGRRVLLFHSGAFAKYLGRVDLVVRMPPPPAEQTPEQRFRGAEIVAHDYYAFPTDSVWCHDHRTTPQIAVDQQDFEAAAAFVRQERPICAAQEDRKTLRLLDEYTTRLNIEFDLTRIFAYAPREILRRSSSTGGDAPLGNITAESMQSRRRVEAEFAVTNTLGIRDAMYRGPVTIESMFNIFPFENTINVMYLSGDEVQEMMDFVTERSAGRGCQSQAQIAGMRFTLDCGQVLRNDEFRTCERAADCVRPGEADPGWQCQQGTCWAHPARDITIGGQPIVRSLSYKLATNDYIAKGGSGFRVLKRNTTRVETGVSLRDALIDYLQKTYCTCEDLLGAADPRQRCPASTLVENGERIVDPLAFDFCRTAEAFHRLRREGGDLLAPGAPRVFAGKCDCNDVLHETGDEHADEDRRTAMCGHVTRALRQFCEDPLSVPIVIGVEDDRISRRLQ